jgi:hypothetical protein
MSVFEEIGVNPDYLDRNVHGRVAKTLIQTAIPDAVSAFESASIAAEHWLNTLAAVRHLCTGCKPNVDEI